MSAQAQDNNPDINGLVRKILSEREPTSLPRKVVRAFLFDGSYIAIADDDTVWFFNRADKRWEPLQDAGVPELPPRPVGA